MMLRRLTQFVRLLGCNLLSQFHDLREDRRIARRYYDRPGFRTVDLALRRHYRLVSPFTISRLFNEALGLPDLHTYGETPLTTLEQIADAAHITANDLVYELGCGSGRTVFWLRTVLGCRTVGVDWNPIFIHRAHAVLRQHPLDGIDFVRADLRQMHYQAATVIYFYGSCADTPSIQALLDRFRALAPGTRIITISYPLSEYDPTNRYRLLTHFPAHFNWGEGTVYVQVVSP